MTTKEAIQAMLDGKKVRDVKWVPEEYIYISEGDIVCEKGTKLYSFNVANTGWEIYEEPKPKQTVVIEKWLCKSASENYFIIEGEEAFFKTGVYVKQKAKLLDTYEVEL